MESSGCWEEKAILARSFSRWVPPEAFIREFRRAGVPGEIDSVCLAHRCHIFRFADAQAREMVLGRPWVINGQPIATEGWHPEFIPAADSVASVLLWVRLPNLPLEFWEDDILRAILLPAGHFLYSDSATQRKNRGGFARACVRVDLRSSLRPGVRVRGLNSPFWQQFQFEHVVGICPDCGTLHLSGPCVPPSPPTGSASSAHHGPFGPWMSAIRQRRPSSAPPSELQKAKSQSASGSGSAHLSSPALNGWKEPGKLARRRVKKTGKAVVVADDVSGLCAGGDKGTVVGSVDFSGFTAVPVSVSQKVNCAGSSEPQRPELSSDSQLMLNPKFTTDNPFAVLGMNTVVERPVVLRDANPAPAKRPRPVESHSQRTAANSEKRKGKGLNHASKISKGKLSLSDSLIPRQGLGVVAGTSDQSTGCPGTVPGGVRDQIAMIEGSDHESVVSRLKMAIQGNGNDSMINAENSSQSAEKATATGAPLVALQLMECSSHMEEVQGGSHPPPN